MGWPLILIIKLTWDTAAEEFFRKIAHLMWQPLVGQLWYTLHALQ
jgi:hypothetical protein